MAYDGISVFYFISSDSQYWFLFISSFLNVSISLSNHERSILKISSFDFSDAANKKKNHFSVKRRDMNTNMKNH